MTSISSETTPLPACPPSILQVVPPIESLPVDGFLSHDPTTAEMIEMRRTTKAPSEWLTLLCTPWSSENLALLPVIDAKFLLFKSYLKNQISSQLLCRLADKDPGEDSKKLDIWSLLGISDEFDKRYINAQIEKFASLYNIRGELPKPSPEETHVNLPSPLFPMYPKFAPSLELNKARKDTERLLELERSKAQKRTQKLLVDQRRQAKLKERTEALNKKNEEKVMRENNREERRQQKVAQREEKDRRAQEQKKAALKRAAELVESNRVPIEITRGATAAVNAAAASAMGIKSSSSPEKKTRSCIVVSTAGDLKQIVITAKNLWIKYNAIAKEHNQKVNWITVAKELGIHVKVREKYARMYARALHRGFDFEEGADCKIKDFPHIFLEPTAHENFKRAVKVEGAASQVLTTDKHLTTPKIEKEEEQVDQEGIGV